MAVCLQKTDLKAKALTFIEEANEATSSPELQAKSEMGGLLGRGRALTVGEGSRDRKGISG